VHTNLPAEHAVLRVVLKANILATSTVVNISAAVDSSLMLTNREATVDVTVHQSENSLAWTDLSLISEPRLLV
jgi:hypothetical protein